MDEQYDLWSVLDEDEKRVSAAIADWLGPFEAVVRALHNAPNALSAVPGFQAADEHLHVAGMALKRALDDLRAMWLLIGSGYTSAAAAVCADLWEHAMLASCAALSPEVASQFMEGSPDDRRFDAQKLAKQVAELTANGLPEADRVDGATVEAWDVGSYVSYKWLCQVKHPTLRALTHTTQPAVSDAGSLSLRATPTGSPDDRDFKIQLIYAAFTVLHEAALYLGVAAVGGNDSPDLQQWMSDLEAAKATLLELAPPSEIRLPWTIADTKTGERLRLAIRTRDEKAEMGHASTQPPTSSS